MTFIHTKSPQIYFIYNRNGKTFLKVNDLYLSRDADLKIAISARMDNRCSGAER